MKKEKNDVSKKLGVLPLGDRVLLKPISADDKKSASGIIIPDTVDKEKPEQGRVIAVGEGRWDEDGGKRIPLSVKIGDKILFSKYGFDEVKVEGEEYYIIKEENILAILK